MSWKNYYILFHNIIFIEESYVKFSDDKVKIVKLATCLL